MINIFTFNTEYKFDPHNNEILRIEKLTDFISNMSHNYDILCLQHVSGDLYNSLLLEEKINSKFHIERHQFSFIPNHHLETYSDPTLSLVILINNNYSDITVLSPVDIDNYYGCYAIGFNNDSIIMNVCLSNNNVDYDKCINYGKSLLDINGYKYLYMCGDFGKSRHQLLSNIEQSLLNDFFHVITLENNGTYNTITNKYSLIPFHHCVLFCNNGDYNVPQLKNFYVCDTGDMSKNDAVGCEFFLSN